MNTQSAARVREGANSHWYTQTGEPLHYVNKADGKGTTPTTLAHARKLNLLPSVTTYLKVLAKPELDSWKQEQACLAVLTSPRIPTEDLDSFVHRVLQVDREQAQEARQKGDLGSRIHKAIALRLEEISDGGILKTPWPEDIGQHCHAAFGCIYEKLMQADVGKLHPEQILVGTEYAGCADLVAECRECDLILDYKSTGTLPTKGSWPEHVLQLSAYAAAWKRIQPLTIPPKPIVTANLYVSTKKPGEIAYFMNSDWRETFYEGFMPITKFWQWMNGYKPNQK